MTIEWFRYTDFLVNEILPSGLVVHLDNLKGPLRSKQDGRNHDAKSGNSASIGKTPTDHTALTESTLSTSNNGDENLAEKLPHPPTEENLPLASQAEKGVSSSTIHPPENASQENQLRKPTTVQLEPSSGPRQREKIRMRQTASELIIVEEDDDFEASEQISEPVSEQKASGSNEKGALLEVLASENTTNKAAQELSGPAQHSTVAAWQAYANVPKGVQVSYGSIQQPLD